MHPVWDEAMLRLIKFVVLVQIIIGLALLSVTAADARAKGKPKGKPKPEEAPVMMAVQPLKVK